MVTLVKTKQDCLEKLAETA